MDSKNFTILYRASAFYEAVRFLFLSIALLSSVFSVFTLNEDLYIELALITLFFIVASWFLKHKINNLAFHAQELQKIHMLYRAYGSIPNIVKLSHLITKITPWSKVYLRFGKFFCCLYEITIGKLLKLILHENENKTDDYLFINDKTARGKLLSMVQENSFWNYHLYRAVCIYRGIFLIITFGFSVFIFLYHVPNINIANEYTLTRLIIAILSISITYEILDKTINYYNSSKIMKEIDAQIKLNIKNKEIDSIDLFDSYNIVKINTPPIPRIIYDIHKKRINEGWKLRVTAANKKSSWLSLFNPCD